MIYGISSCKAELTSQPEVRFSLHDAITSQQVVYKAKHQVTIAYVVISDQKNPSDAISKLCKLPRDDIQPLLV